MLYSPPVDTAPDMIAHSFLYNGDSFGDSVVKTHSIPKLIVNSKSTINYRYNTSDALVASEVMYLGRGEESCG